MQPDWIPASAGMTDADSAGLDSGFRRNDGFKVTRYQPPGSFGVGRSGL